MSYEEEDDSVRSLPAPHPRTVPTAPAPPTALSQIDNSRPFVLLLDNYDSFTWNLYQYISQLGAHVQVLRNDDLLPADFAQLNVSHLVISPGPGHPRTDSGVSRAAIQHFGGRVPVLGVCMGLQCLVDAYGGDVSYAGEIVHGKASRVRHDGLGIFRGVPQDILATRYHSLAATLPSFPRELAITATTSDSGVVMGVRHRMYAVEAVQYHPESILSHDGHAILRNFLAYTGGTWAQNPDSGVLPTAPASAVNGNGATVPGQNGFDPSPESAAKKALPSILGKIQAQRLVDIELAKKTPGTTPADLATLYALHLAPTLIPVLPRMRAGTKPAIMAEIKRASPSKGHIAVSTSAPAQALAYALAGASVISVLTEPKWFLGTLQDLRLAREAVAHLPNRPAILRKDFILDEYQILEARLAGADLVLLIVAMLSQERLASLYAYSKSLGMEPLVEVNNAVEMERALVLNAKLIGVNNRNLHNFSVDMGTTTRLADMLKNREDVLLCALSGISSRADVQVYLEQGVHAVLVGESLMRASDPKAFIRQLLGQPPAPPAEPIPYPHPLVKVCGIRMPEEALLAAHAGADMLGLNFVPQSKRYIDLPTAAVIARTVLPLRLSPSPAPLADAEEKPQSDGPVQAGTTWFQHTTSHISALPRPLLVGLFQDAPLATILHSLATVPLDLVQLHGSEPAGMAQFIPVPVIKAYHVGPLGEGTEHVGRPGQESVVLLDTAPRPHPSTSPSSAGAAIPPPALAGGTGEAFDWSIAAEVVKRPEPLEGRAMPIMLAGGLKPENVREAVRRVRPWAVDVASGVEVDGRKDETTMRAFVAAAKGAWEEIPVQDVLEPSVNGPAAQEEEGVDVGTEVIGQPTGTTTAAPPVPTPGSSGISTPAPAPANVVVPPLPAISAKRGLVREDK
ncbi:IGPS-domain-containing protein [Calocera viscosa TUFC12733]|uniref:Multifunctional tryptophan biosynthesis protein n=1 Tax=Calocera viscosa (strain TUFC12733) TaxID=1330018 RepID=A0A167LWG7_CALVF|nr:IGPS-domain-containing protein [Calocera viscosa TUFC12733]